MKSRPSKDTYLLVILYIEARLLYPFNTGRLNFGGRFIVGKNIGPAFNFILGIRLIYNRDYDDSIVKRSTNPKLLD